MSTDVRIIIYTTNEEAAPALRRDLLSIDGVKIVAEIDDTILLAQAAEQFPADIVFVDLDPLPEEVFPIASALALEKPYLSVFALSESTDGQLILSAMRAGISEFLTKPLDLELLTIAFEKVAEKRVAGITNGKLITVIGSAGGVGATSIACNLAVELAGIVEEGRVALVDLDYRFGQVATLLDVQPSFTLADLADSTEQVEKSVIQQAMIKHNSGVYVLARPNSFAQADMITAAHCASILATLQSMYDYVVVDGPNRFDVGSKAVLDIADFNLLIIQLLVTSVRNVHRIVDEIRAVGFNLDRIKVICNRVGKESGSVSVEYVEETLNHKVFFSLPDEWQTVSSSINMGVSLLQEYGKTKIRLAIRELAELIHRPDQEKAEQPTASSKGVGALLSKMFNKG